MFRSHGSASGRRQWGRVVKCWNCGTAVDVALVGPSEWCRSCFSDAWAAGVAIDNRPQPIIVSPRERELIVGVVGGVRVCSLQDFVEHFGEGHRWHGLVSHWFCHGGRALVFESAELKELDDFAPERGTDAAKE